MAVITPTHAPPVDGTINQLNALASFLPAISGDDLSSMEMQRLMTAVRSVQRAADSLAIRLGIAADGHAERDGGRGSHGLFLGDGQAVSGATARREAARSWVCSTLDHVGSAVRSGRLGAAQVDLFARAARKLDCDQRHELNDADLIEAAAREPVDVFARTIQRFVDLLRCDHGNTDNESQRRASMWRSWIDADTGMGHVHGEFDPERFEAIRNAVQAQAARLAAKGGVQRTANLAAAAAYELLTGSAAGRSGALPSIGVIVDWKTFTSGAHRYSVCETFDGQPLSPGSISRLACNAVIQRIVVDERGVPLNVGRRYRTATAAQWLALKATYRSCAWAGCDRPLSWCQIHHVHEWEHGGSTDLCNLVPLCNEHHHAVHEGGWHLELLDDRRLDIRSPDGQHQYSVRPDRLPAASDRANRGVRPRPTARTHRPATHRPAQPAGP